MSRVKHESRQSLHDQFTKTKEKQDRLKAKVDKLKIIHLVLNHIVTKPKRACRKVNKSSKKNKDLVGQRLKKMHLAQDQVAALAAKNYELQWDVKNLERQH